MAQTKAVIGGWLTEQDGAAFTAYASEIGIDSNALATLLLVREMSENSLAATRAIETRESVQKGRRITARTDPDLKRRFREHAAQHGLSSDAAASRVFRIELTERWLGKCVGVSGESG